MSYTYQFASIVPKRPLDYSRWQLDPLTENQLLEGKGIDGDAPPAGIGNWSAAWSHYNPATDTCDMQVAPAIGDIDWNKSGGHRARACGRGPERAGSLPRPRGATRTARSRPTASPCSRATTTGRTCTSRCSTARACSPSAPATPRPRRSRTTRSRLRLIRPTWRRARTSTATATRTATTTARARRTLARRTRTATASATPASRPRYPRTASPRQSRGPPATATR